MRIVPIHFLLIPKEHPYKLEVFQCNFGFLLEDLQGGFFEVFSLWTNFEDKSP